MPAQYKAGDRIQVTSMGEAHDRIVPGVTGTVRRWNPAVFQLDVAWDEPIADCKLMLALDVDRVRLI